MSKRIISLSNLNEAITTGMLVIKQVRSETKVCSYDTETEFITPDTFIESIQFLNETVFKNAVDFYYEFTGQDTVNIKCGLKNPYMSQAFYAECVIKECVSHEDLEKKLRETIFDRAAKEE